MYLNSVYWGQARGFAVGGIAEAARWYFDAPVESLGVLEGATLAAMIPAPNVFNPFVDAAKTLERRNAVLREMVCEARHERMRHARARTVRHDVADTCLGWRLQQSGYTLCGVEGDRHRLRIRAHHGFRT